MRLFHIAVSLSIVILVWSHSVAQDEHPSAQRVSDLIAQLDRDDFSVREKATQELIRIGPPAYAPLIEALQSSSAEVRARAETILVASARADWLKALHSFDEPPARPSAEDLRTLQKEVQDIRAVTHSQAELEKIALDASNPVSTREAALVAMEKHAVPGQVDNLIDLLKDSGHPARIRQRIAVLLGNATDSDRARIEAALVSVLSCDDELAIGAIAGLNTLWKSALFTVPEGCEVDGLSPEIQRLLLVPARLIEYVVFHEMVHLRHRRHDAQFWRVLRAKYADSANREKELLGYWMRMQRTVQ